MIPSEQPLSKLTRALSAARTRVDLNINSLDERLAKVVYSAIPNKAITVRILYARRTDVSNLTAEELESIHLLIERATGRSHATFSVRAFRGEHSEYGIVDGTRLISCLGLFRNLYSSDDANLISVSADPKQTAHVSALFDFSWRQAQDISEQTLFDAYTARPHPDGRSLNRAGPAGSHTSAPTPDQLIEALTPSNTLLPIDRLLEYSELLKPIVLPAPLAALARSSLEQKYRSALTLQRSTIDQASRDVARIRAHSGIHNEIAHTFLDRISILLNAPEISTDLVLSIRHDSLNDGVDYDDKVLNSFDPTIIYTKVEDRAQLGKALWELCVKLTAIDFGVVRRFGPPAGAELTTACGMEFVALLWDELQLGPLLTASNYKAVVPRDLARAFYRLLALIFNETRIRNLH